MSRYVIYSVNAHLKSWDDAAEDATTDPMMNFDDITSLPGVACTCGNFLPQACGVSTCAPTEMYSKKFCTPADCGCVNPGDCDQCTADPSCCTRTPNGGCGAGGCAPTAILMTVTCGTNPPSNQCEDSETCGPFSCQGPVPANATLCPGDNTGLTSNDFNKIVSACSAAKCEYTCDAGFILVNGACEEDTGPCPGGQVQCWSCSAEIIFSEAPSGCSGFNGCVGRNIVAVIDHICAACPAPPTCSSCEGFSLGGGYIDENFACSAARTDAETRPCSGRSQPVRCGYAQYSGNPADCICSYTCENSCAR